jgi:A/G-specific adenine glycosylase
MSKIEKRCFNALIKWSKHNFSDLPWRKKRTPYTTWISEVMLQQTTVATVLKRYPIFLNKFSTAKSVALSSEEDVLKQWQGLGYYRRARNIFKGCQQLKEYGYKLPQDFKTLKSISGIGDYTANAILSFAFNQDTLAVDVNVNRVLSRFYTVDNLDTSKVEQRLIKLNMNMANLTEAVMDCGRVYCQKNKTDCLLCPLSTGCKAFLEDQVDQYPKIKTNLKKKKALILQRLIIAQGEKIVLTRREKGQWLEGQWELPTFIYESEVPLTQYPYKKFRAQEVFKINSVITHHKIENRVIKSKVKVEGKWVRKSDLHRYHLSSITVKILNKLDLL